MITTVLENREIAPGCRYLLVDAPEIAKAAKPGQFVHVLCGTTYDPLLRRPLGIHEVDVKTGRFAMLYEVRGRGTSILAERCIGDKVDILGPLGNGFTLPDNDNQPVILVAGGIGIAPIYYLTQQIFAIRNLALSRGYIKRKRIHFYFGAKDAEKIYRLADFKKLARRIKVRCATDCQSEHQLGTVIDAMNKYVKAYINNHPDEDITNPKPIIYACGPIPMLKAVISFAREKNLACQVSTEAKMACGVGACMSCVIKVKTNLNAADDSFKYVRSCKEGPVFNADEVIW